MSREPLKTRLGFSGPFSRLPVNIEFDRSLVNGEPINPSGRRVL
jgi:hypothetical protein